MRNTFELGRSRIQIRTQGLKYGQDQSAQPLSQSAAGVPTLRSWIFAAPPALSKPVYVTRSVAMMMPHAMRQLAIASPAIKTATFRQERFSSIGTSRSAYNLEPAANSSQKLEQVPALERSMPVLPFDRLQRHTPEAPAFRTTSCGLSLGTNTGDA